MGLMEAGWSARLVARQLGRSDCVMRRCWDQWIREIYLHEDQAQDALDRTVVEKTATSKETHAYNQLLHRPPLRHRVSQDCLSTVITLLWPARFPDLSPVEHIWDHLGWRVGHSTSLNELEARLQQIWNEMSQDIKQNLYGSMPDRIASCIRARGGSTGY
ncbi:transposable element Tcb1 transposase [Trichonephila clavipes]|uniref:Transposable element Tcb1 transposase n=1 Tax=Trichonephila clavipes TaxID=2585209 RepID=A0A8X6VXD2_TRICX|nr:transposable element Tcb1 transposase [Trichonephila clavipes]